MSPTTIPSFKIPLANREDNTEFNYCVAVSRVRNEHCIGILKGRWASLKEVRIQLNKKDDMQRIVNWFTACVVLHNFLVDLNDPWEEMFDEDQAQVVDGDPVPQIQDVEAFEFREALKQNVLRHNYEIGVLPIRR